MYYEIIESRSDVVFYLEKNHDLRRKQLRQCGVFFATDLPGTDNKIDSPVGTVATTHLLYKLHTWRMN